MAVPDLGLPLTLENHVQINNLFVDEVTRDMDSPMDAKFQYSIPRIKKELLSMEQVSMKYYSMIAWHSGPLDALIVSTSVRHILLHRGFCTQGVVGDLSR
jgi:hypothetical protein